MGGVEVNVLELLSCSNPTIRNFAEDIYSKVFEGYNVKMWGGQNIDKSVIGRAPIRLSRNDIRSKKLYNFVPQNGYTALFKKILSHANITICLNTNAADIISVRNGKLLLNGEIFEGKVFYTGPIDELLNYKYGGLEYRSIYFEMEYIPSNSFFSGLALTFPMDFEKIRTSDMCRVTGISKQGKVALVHEYAGEYCELDDKYNIPSYPVINEENQERYKKYFDEIYDVKNLYILGRLAEYKYYDMGQVIEKTWEVLSLLCKKSLI